MISAICYVIFRAMSGRHCLSLKPPEYSPYGYSRKGLGAVRQRFRNLGCYLVDTPLASRLLGITDREIAADFHID